MNQPVADFALLRFLRAGTSDTGILNDGDDTGAASRALAGDLMRAARLLPARGGRAGTPYAAIKSSHEFAAYRALTGRLRGFDPASLTGRRERTAFWINLYNALVIDAVISFGVGDSIREALGFFHRAAYRVGPYRFALDEIEHGLLRANRPQFLHLPPPFAADDPRIALGPGTLDPRIHFALNCGTRSCPPVAFYDAGHLDEQLETAAFSFINTEAVRRDADALVLSPLFAFYAADFGGPDGVRDWLLRYLTDPDTRARLEGGQPRTGVYDWSLNRG